jgi:hypothetical protein
MCRTGSGKGTARRAPLPALHDLDLFLRQTIQLIHQPVDLAVGLLDLAGQAFFFIGQSRRSCVSLYLPER